MSDPANWDFYYRTQEEAERAFQNAIEIFEESFLDVSIDGYGRLKSDGKSYENDEYADLDQYETETYYGNGLWLAFNNEKPPSYNHWHGNRNNDKVWLFDLRMADLYENGCSAISVGVGKMGCGIFLDSTSDPSLASIYKTLASDAEFIIGEAECSCETFLFKPAVGSDQILKLDDHEKFEEYEIFRDSGATYQVDKRYRWLVEITR